MTAFFDLVHCGFRHFNAIVEFAVAGLHQSLMKMTFGEDSRQVTGRQGLRESTGLGDGRLAGFAGWLARRCRVVRVSLGTGRRENGARNPQHKARG